ncbi:hypothetical protein [Methylobacterium aerolatum]|uniref:Uncharacterized protein n=1 Tax=Methylobacterium aerolatum TaxID=418708 RepID=A0ABU0HTR2_9HYPH|nr:hypothetical protein [Methylobacterium aerolatum]MDQ0445718.1 hypothetical protein [Methylobacterium aerolatum]GJD36172.1 hypothetical protein FMGBMHLM_3086 [Methylobacterium aerolatum]
MATQPNPLPDSLTRLLRDPAARSFASTPGDLRRGETPAPPPRDRLDTLVVRGVAVAASALVWCGILWLMLRHLAP